MAGIRPLAASWTRFPCSVLRANPFSEVTDPFCRLPLPTFIRSLEASHLGDLMRLWVRSGVSNNRSSRFSRASRSAPDAATSAALCQLSVPSRRANQFQGASIVKKKRKLFLELRPASLDSVALPRLPRPGARILTRFSFGGRRELRPFFPLGCCLRID